MIFIGFLLISGMFFLFAHFAGGMQYFFNLDSLLIPLVATTIFSIFTFKTKVAVKGIKHMFLFHVNGFEKDENVGRHYFSLMVVSVAGGICSTFQGLMNGILFGNTLPEAERLPLEYLWCIASFTTVYAVMYAIFLFYPVYLLNKREP